MERRNYLLGIDGYHVDCTETGSHARKHFRLLSNNTEVAKLLALSTAGAYETNNLVPMLSGLNGLGP